MPDIEFLTDSEPLDGSSNKPHRRIASPGLSRRIVALSLVGLSLVAAAVQASPDPFYSSRLREGTAAAARGNHAEAAKMLRIACFGLLEEDGLAECLLRLGLSQAAIRDVAGFGHTFRRLVEAEALLSTYSRAELDPTLLAAYKTRVKELVAESIWQGTLDFAATANPAGLDDLGLSQSPAAPPMSERERRRFLQRSQKDSPGDAQWPRQLAVLERGADRPKAAMEAARETLQLAPGDPAASCVLGWVHATQDNCRAAQPYLANCGSLDADLQQIANRCEAEIAAERAEEEAALEQAALDQTALAASESETRAETLGDDPAITGSPTEVSTEPADSPALPMISPEEARADLEAIRQQLTSAGRIDQLNELFARTQTVLETLPNDRSAHFLAAEIAYRASRWDDAVAHFTAGGDPGDDNPRLLFYLAIAQYESGDVVAAEVTLRRCIDRLSVSPFVERYREAILGS